MLIEAADEMPNVAFRFGQLCLGLAHEKNVLEMRDEATGHIYHTDAQPSIATDGAGSRRAGCVGGARSGDRARGTAGS